ncbi:polyhydroxyalkanoate granule-associated phasin [Ottowia sp.]|uniref:polyhydroxyalkanoate granule-associated phasin n=1 Tax=Ottowia sp. TaxID=1898956 RepID=UPI003A89C32D
MNQGWTQLSAAWWREAAELGWAAPQVVAHRVTRMMLAGAAPEARDRREFTRMGAEKLAAFQTSWQTMASRSLALQQQWVQQAMAMGWSMALGGAWLGPSQWSRVMAKPMNDAWAAALDVSLHGLRPVGRKAKANARRLSRTPLARPGRTRRR